MELYSSRMKLLKHSVLTIITPWTVEICRLNHILSGTYFSENVYSKEVKHDDDLQLLVCVCCGLQLPSAWCLLCVLCVCGRGGLCQPLLASCCVLYTASSYFWLV